MNSCKSLCECMGFFLCGMQKDLRQRCTVTSDAAGLIWRFMMEYGGIAYSLTKCQSLASQPDASGVNSPISMPVRSCSPVTVRPVRVSR